MAGTLENILPLRLFELLERNGICTPRQIFTLSLFDIKKLTNLSNEDILLVKNIVSDDLQPHSIACDQLLMQERKKNKVTTGCDSINNLLKGGFRCGVITEIYGESGSGKTQIGIQAAAFNWDTGCVYICTEDLFPVKRYDQVKNSISGYDKKIDYGKNVFVEHITEPHDLMSCIRIRLPKLLNKQKISLIIIDSIAAPFRVEITNYVQRAEELRELAVLLIDIAQKYNLAVLCINQVTAAFNESVEEVIPSLGLAWSNMINTRLWLKKTQDLYHCKTNTLNEDIINIRELSVQFAPDLPNSYVKFVVTINGIQGIYLRVFIYHPLVTSYLKIHSILLNR